MTNKYNQFNQEGLRTPKSRRERILERLVTGTWENNKPVKKEECKNREEEYLLYAIDNRLQLLDSDFIFKDKQIVSHCQTYQKLSDGTKQSVTFRHYYKALVGAYDLKLAYGNFYVNGSTTIADTFNTNDIIVKASIEYKTKIFPVKFKGQDSIIIKAGATIESDPLGIDIAENDAFYVRTYVSVTNAGEKFPCGLSINYANGEGEGTGDLTITGSTTPSYDANTYHPLAILGKGSRKRSVLLCGDSLLTNYGSPSDYVVTGGYAGLALNNANIPYTSISKSGDLAGSFVNNENRYCRANIIKNCTDVIVEYGINDVSSNTSLANLKTYLTSIWTSYANRGLKVYQATITPYTISTDSWATAENQTPKNAVNETVRVQLNDWIRTCPKPLNGFLEIADLAETSRNSGIWKAGYSYDGLHPKNDVGMSALSQGINLDYFK